MESKRYGILVRQHIALPWCFHAQTSLERYLVRCTGSLIFSNVDFFGHIKIRVRTSTSLYDITNARFQTLLSARN